MPSIKHFHILFVLASIFLFIFFAYWSFVEGIMYYFYGSIISILVIGFYGIKFYSKVKELSL